MQAFPKEVFYKPPSISIELNDCGGKDGPIKEM